MIEVCNLSACYGARTLFSSLNFTIQTGELVAVLGQNGVGKTSLLKSMLHVHTSYDGHIKIDGQRVDELTAKQRAKKMAYVPQVTGAHFTFSVYEVVLMGCLSRLSLGISPSKADCATAEHAMEELGIAHLAQKSLHQISGGERQLVFIARALVQNAEIFILDEPTASLDIANQTRVLQEISALSKRGYTVVYTTHNPEHAYQYSDKILLLRQDETAVLGHPKALINAPMMSQLYGTEMAVHSLLDDDVRICIPTEREYHTYE